MKTLYLTVIKQSDHGTFGILSDPATGWTCFTGEPPWRDNRSNVSCIPAGEYVVQIRYSKKYGKVYHVRDVEGRTYILHHSGNLAGDITKGLRTHTAGCILLGRFLGQLLVNGQYQRAVLASKSTVRNFMEHMKGEPFKLIVMGGER